MTPLMARSGGTSRARTFCPSVCNDGGRVEVDVPVVQVVDVGAVQLLDKVAVSWRQSGGRRLDAFCWGVGAHHTGDELN